VTHWKGLFQIGNMMREKIADNRLIFEKHSPIIHLVTANGSGKTIDVTIAKVFVSGNTI